jgi:hypothetical protein
VTPFVLSQIFFVFGMADGEVADPANGIEGGVPVFAVKKLRKERKSRRHAGDLWCYSEFRRVSGDRRRHVAPCE